MLIESTHHGKFFMLVPKYTFVIKTFVKNGLKIGHIQYDNASQNVDFQDQEFQV